MSQIKNIFQSQNQVDYFTKQAVIAALYVAITMLFAPFGFLVIQFRVSELLMLMILIDRRYIVGLTLGVLVANLFSPLGVVDLVFGTTATGLALVVYIIFAKQNIYHRIIIFISSLTLFNAVIIGSELTYLGITEHGFLFSAFSVGISELILMIIASMIYILGQDALNIFKLK
ncbi:MAG: QueT transporter family protein [Culicoidibacterales bacterium]